MMWDCAMQKHEVYRVAILKAFIFLGSRVKCKELRLIYQKIKKTTLNHTDKFLMRLLETIAKNISKTIDGDLVRGKLHAGKVGSRRYDIIMGSGTESKKSAPQRRSSETGIANKS
jgi:transcriptional regulator CtsR